MDRQLESLKRLCDLEFRVQGFRIWGLGFILYLGFNNVGFKVTRGIYKVECMRFGVSMLPGVGVGSHRKPMYHSL